MKTNITPAKAGEGVTFMKYNFIYDESFLENKKFDLSQDECDIVRAVITGGHNVCIRGYRPERIVNAIKAVINATNPCPMIEAPTSIEIEGFCGGGADLKMGSISLANNGILIMRDLDNFRSSVLSMLTVPMDTGTITLSRGGNTVNYPAKFQLVSTLSGKDGDSLSTRNIINRCEIEYFCSQQADRHLVRIDNLKNQIERDWLNHLCATDNLNYKNQEIDDMSKLEFTSEALELYERDIKGCFVNPLMIVKVARTLADMRGHLKIRCVDLEKAKSWHISVETQLW